MNLISPCKEIFHQFPSVVIVIKQEVTIQQRKFNLRRWPPALFHLVSVSLLFLGMGNAAASCAPSMISSGVVKVFFNDGRLRIYTKPVRAAELMLENPGEFVCDSSHLKVGYRIPGLSADEELQPRQIYFLLPMEMLYSVLTSEEMNMLNDRASKALKQGSLNFSKIFPLLGDHFCLFPNSESKTLDSAEICEELNESYSRQRSWTPALETIIEMPTPPHA